MTQISFPILGTKIPDLYGRSTTLEALSTALKKSAPNQNQIVGPRFSGKTVLLKALEKKIKDENHSNLSIVYWDMGHQTPTSNDELLEQLAKKIGEAIQDTHHEYADYLLDADDHFYTTLKEVISELAREDHKVALLLDGFEKPLASTNLSRHLWDQLRELASNQNLRIITANRRTIREEIRSEESLASDFWNIFNDPIRIDRLNESDVSEITSALDSYSFNTGAIKQIENWTSNYPPLFFSLLNQLQTKPNGTISTDDVNEAAKIISERASEILADMWRDLSESSKNLIRYLMDNETVSTSGHKEEANTASYFGFVQINKNHAKLSCNFLREYLSGLVNESGSLVHLFKDNQSYKNNIRAVLEYRASQIPSIDHTLSRLINRAIEDIPDDPTLCLTTIRSIIDQSLDLIWDKEFNQSKEIPEDILENWRKRDRHAVPDSWGSKVPSGRGDQIKLLRLITGSHEKIVSTAKFVTKNTYTLCNALHCIGNFGQHRDNTTPTLGLAISAVTMCIELADCLAEELRGNQAD